MDETNDEFIEIKAGNRLLAALGNTPMDLLDNLCELIDNPIEARPRDKSVSVEIEIAFSRRPGRSHVKVKDNSSGMSKYKLERGLRPGEKDDEEVRGLHEHGMGLNHAIAGIGNLRRIVTKQEQDEKAIECRQYNMGKLPIHRVDFDRKHGTTIEIDVVEASKLKYRREDYYTLITNLGARYRYFLAGKDLPHETWRPSLLPYRDPILELTVTLIDVDNEGKRYPHQIQPTFPCYLHPQTKENKPLVEKKLFSGRKTNWEACLIAGFAPNKKEAIRRGIQLKHHDPYGVRPGFDVIMHNRVIMAAQTKGLEIIPHDLGNTWMKFRGEIHLLKGFASTSCKIAIQETEQFTELKQEIKQYLHDIKFFSMAPAKSQSELEVCQKLQTILAASPGVKKVEAGWFIGQPAYPVDFLVTLLSNEQVVYEVKIGNAGSAEVMQPFSRCIMNPEYSKTSYLLAKEFSDEAQKAAKCLQGIGYEVRLVPIQNFINIDEL